MLTGAKVTDPSNAVSTGLLNAQTGEWDAALLEAFEAPRAWLPRLVPTGARIGALAAGPAGSLDLAPGTPVIHGGGDAPAAAVGAGVLTGAQAMIILGTGAQVIRPRARYAPEPEGRWHTWPAALPPGAGGDRWLGVGAVLNGGRAIDWIHRTLAPGVSRADLFALAQTAPAGSGNLLFLPFLAGERSPLLDPFARGGFIGLSEAHGPPHLVRAVLEGIALSLADTLERMTPGDERPEEIVFGGGSPSNDLRQIMASVLGVPLSTPPAQECSAFGAGRIAAHTLGWSVIGEQGTWGQPSSSPHSPLAFDRDRSRQHLALYREAVEATLPTMHRLQRQQP